jgi:hypothetical protein
MYNDREAFSGRSRNTVGLLHWLEKMLSSGFVGVDP